LSNIKNTQQTNVPLKTTKQNHLTIFNEQKENENLFPDSVSSIEASPSGFSGQNRVFVPDLDYDESDIFVVPEYAAEIDSHLKEAELRTRPKPNYMKKQNDLTPQMRSILVDWLVEVAIEYKMYDETLYLAVNYVDRFLSQMAVLRGKLQLVGTAAMLLASKFEEIYAPEVTEFVYITDETYTRQQVLRMEHLMVKVLKFDICCVTPLSFINRLLKSIQADEQITKVAKFLCDLSLLEYNLVKVAPSLIAAAVVLQANFICRGQGWSDALEHYSGYTYDAVKPVVEELQNLHVASKGWAHQTVYSKYEEISSIAPRNGPPPRASSDEMNISLNSL
jgi:cyclin A